MAADFQMTFRRYGRFYQSTRQYMQRKEVLVSTNVILTLFTVSFFAAFAIRPTALTISRLWREIQDKTTVRQQLESKITELGEGQAMLLDLEEELALLDRAVPPGADFSRLVRIVEYVAGKHGLALSSSRYSEIPLYESGTLASASAEAGQLVTHPFSLTVNGSFSSLRSFIEELERLDRLITVSSVTLRPTRAQAEEGLIDLQINVESSAYSFPKGAELSE